MAKVCPKCNKKIGFFSSESSAIYEGKEYCLNCYLEIAPKNYGKKCYNCRYYGVDYNYDGYCKFNNNKYADRYDDACKNFVNK